MRITRTDDTAKGGKHSEPQARAKTEAPTMTQPLEDWTTEDLQRELNQLTGRRALERNRTILIRMITKLRQQKQDKLEAKAEAETPTMTQRLATMDTTPPQKGLGF